MRGVGVGSGVGEEAEKAELLVFGYACKLFRDDEKAASIDSGSHLIPWMGDDSLKIDRYDGRGALYDLSAHEPKPSYNVELGDEEVAVELLCEEERYRSLRVNEDEELTYREESAKRQHHQGTAYGEVAYSYEAPPSHNTQETTPTDPIQTPTSGRPFVVPPELQIPPEMGTPKTTKHNAIIERTALFLAQQGSQMEILMKVKQQGNRYFDFLSHTDPLHGYYLHLKGLIKSGSYVPREQDVDEEEEDGDENYLHPSLVPASGPASLAAPAQLTTQQAPKPPPTDSNAPPDFVQKIIEVMVKFVVRNGLRFEGVIMRRGDVRFSFLNPKNPYNAFYKQQLGKKQSEVAAPPAKSAVDSNNDEDCQDGKSTRKRKTPLPVCFSIKKPKETEGLEVPSALPIEESSDDDEFDPSEEQNSPTATPPNESSLEPQLLSATLEKILRSTGTTQKSQRKREVVHSERKIKVAKFLNDLKKKTNE